MSYNSGSPGTSTQVSDLGNIPAPKAKGIICVKGITKRGKPGETYLISSYTDYLNKLGGAHDDDDFWLMCKHSLENGGILRIARDFHYTDITDASSIEGTKATGTLTTGPVVEVLATTTFSITGGTSSPGVNKVNGITVNGVQIMSGAVDWVTSHSDTATAVASNITAHTSAPNYSAAAVGALITISAAAGSGVTPNGFVVVVTVAGDVTASAPAAMSGGVSADIERTVEIEAEAVGDGYNGSTMTIAASVNNDPLYVDITILMNDAVNPVLFQKVKRDPSTVELEKLNLKLEGMIISTITGELPYGTVTLSGGVQDISDIDTTDVNGNSAAKNGWYSFDEVTDSMRIWNFNNADPLVNSALSAYCATRTDMRGRGRVPLGLSVQGLNDYLDGTGPYNHQPLDEWYFDVWYTDGEITDPDDPEITNKQMSLMGFSAANRSITDSRFGEWISSSGGKRGKIKYANKVAINFGAPGNKAAWDVLYPKGLNAIIKHKLFGIIDSGNTSTKKDRTSVLSKSNIADFVVMAANRFRDEAAAMNFDPNDVSMFGELYRRMRRIIVNEWVNGRAIEGRNTSMDGEGKWWHYIGDQFANDLNGLTFNQKLEVDGGGYKLRFAFKGIASNEWILVDLAPTDSVTIQNIQVLQTLNL